MAKFIIEVSDEYIREHADVEKMKDAMGSEGKGRHPMALMVDFIGFSVIERKLDEGVNEFRVNYDEIENEMAKKFFDNNIGDICNLVYMSSKDDEKQSEKSE